MTKDDFLAEATENIYVILQNVPAEWVSEAWEIPNVKAGHAYNMAHMVSKVGDICRTEDYLTLLNRCLTVGQLVQLFEAIQDRCPGMERTFRPGFERAFAKCAPALPSMLSSAEIAARDKAVLNQTEYCETHPPRCIAGFATELGELDRVYGHGPKYLNIVFRLSCSCGSDGHLVLVHPWPNPHKPEQIFHLDPIALRCGSCKKVTDLIDTTVHGYDAELGTGSATMRGEGIREEFACGECDLKKVFQVFVRFEYPDDLFSDDFKDYEGRRQDLFTWFSLIAKCANCSSMSPVVDFACA